MSEAQGETFISHLVELRSRIVRAGASVLLVFVCLMPWANRIYDLLAAPMIETLQQGMQAGGAAPTMIAIGVVTPFFVPVKVTLMVAFLLCLPVVLYQAWAFVAPGLYSHERRLALPLVLASTLLFLLGMAFCYFFVFRTVFQFIATVAPKSITAAPDIEQYLSFVMTMFLAFGIAFEVPVAVVVLVRAGMVGIEKLRAARRYIIVAAFIIAAIVTPPDVVSQLMLAIPMILLYEIGLLLAGAGRKPAAAAQEAENLPVPAPESSPAPAPEGDAQK